MFYVFSEEDNKSDLRLFMLCKYKLRHTAYKTSVNINRVLWDESTSKQTERMYFQKFCSVLRALKIKKVVYSFVVSMMNNCKTSLSEMPLVISLQQSQVIWQARERWKWD